MHTGHWRPSASSLKKLFAPFQPHIERATGTLEENVRYCKKGQMCKEEYNEWRDFGFPDPAPPSYGIACDFHENGERPLNAGLAGNKVRRENRERANFLQMIKEGATDMQLAEADFDKFSRQQNGIRSIRSMMKPVREAPNVIYLHVGETGIGKTASIRAQFGSHNIFEPVLNADKNSINYAGYSRQPVLLLDEFYGKMPLALALRLLDPFFEGQVNAKYGQVYLFVKVIALTSNKHPSEWYDFSTRRKLEAAFRRRFYDHAIVIDNFKKVTDMNVWWPIEGYDMFMPEKKEYDSFMPVPFVVPEIKKTWTLDDVWPERNGVNSFNIVDESSSEDFEDINKQLDAIVASGEINIVETEPQFIDDRSPQEILEEVRNENVISPAVANMLTDLESQGRVDWPGRWPAHEQDVRNHLAQHIGAPADYDDIVDYERVRRRMIQLTERITDQNVADLL